MKVAEYKKIATQRFLEKNFEEALLHYREVLHLSPKDKEAYIGVLLSDMAEDNEQEAFSLFEYYLASKDEDDFEGIEMLESIIETFDLGMEMINGAIEENSEEMTVYQNGISYEDFNEIIKSRGSFALAYQDIIYSSRVVITKKDDFFDFINSLIDNGYQEVALNYLESASSVFVADNELTKLYSKISDMGAL